eukprot:5637518-Alexandrium_andersonii.AAC.1
MFAAGHCACLYTESHTRGWTEVDSGGDSLRLLLAPLLLRLSPMAGSESGVRIEGIPPTALLPLLAPLVAMERIPSPRFRR